MRRRLSRDGVVDLVHLLGYKRIMIKLNVHEAKTHLSRYLEKLARGETILLCKRNIPIAEIRPLPRRRKTNRPIGLAKGKFKITPGFFAPLPSELVDAFDGEKP